MIKEALGMSIDDYTRYNNYSLKNDYPIDFTPFANLFSGGYSKGALYCIMAPSKMGKSTLLVNMGLDCYKKGYNVLYVSLEMSESLIYRRIDRERDPVPDII